MKKTALLGSEWLLYFPPSIRDKIKTNCKPGRLKITYLNLEVFLDSAFVWDDSPEKHEYWHFISCRIRTGEFNEKFNDDKGWIKVSDLKPSVNEADKFGKVLFRKSDDSQWIFNFDIKTMSKYTHWRSLPEL